MIFAAYSCVDVFFTHLRTTEKAPLEGEGGKNWDTEQSRATQTHFRSEDSDAPITRPLVKITHTHTSVVTITIQPGAEGCGLCRPLNRCGWRTTLLPRPLTSVLGKATALTSGCASRAGGRCLKHTPAASHGQPCSPSQEDGRKEDPALFSAGIVGVGEGEIRKRVCLSNTCLPQPWGGK